MRIANESASALLLALASCAPLSESGFDPQASADAVALPAVSTAPLVAHHQHLMSLEAAQLGHASLAEVTLPPEIAPLVRDRGRLSDMSQLMALYTTDAVMLHLGNYWIRGRADIRSFLGGNGYYRLAPTAYRITDSMAFITGTFKTGVAGSEQFFRNFHITAVKEGDGVWRIAAESFTPEPAYVPRAYTADHLLEEMDAAGVQRAVVLSVAYWIASPGHEPVPDERARLMAENDWTLEQVSRYPDRLVAFCSLNPLSDYAVEELERCAAAGFAGLKVHLGNSRVNLNDAAHRARVRDVFAAANRLRLPIVVHAWPYLQQTTEYATVFLNEVLPAAPDIWVQLAHLGGDGGYHAAIDRELAVFADAVQRGDPRTRRLIFDICQIAQLRQSAATQDLITRRLRQIGLDRVFFGSDMPPNPSMRASWAVIDGVLSLTEGELATIAGNVAPYLRDAREADRH